MYGGDDVLVTVLVVSCKNEVQNSVALRALSAERATLLSQDVKSRSEIAALLNPVGEPAETEAPASNA
jgi:hypothetical protein